MVTRIIALLETLEHSEEINESLEGAKCEVEVVTTFAKAKAFLQGRSCDLIISDVHLENGGSVFDFLKWVKKEPRLRAIPFVLFGLERTEMAKYLSDGVRTSARFLGAAKYISMAKFDRATFRSEIEWLLPNDRVGDYYAERAGDGDGKTGSNDRVLLGRHSEVE